MENTAIVLIIITNLMLVLILGTLGFLIYKLLKNQGKATAEAAAEKKETDKQYHPAILERMKALQMPVKAKRTDLYCPNHSDEPGEASCAVCDKLYCKACIRPYKSLHFCREHLQLIMRHDWEEVVTIKTSTHDPEEGVRLYDLKKELFEKEDLPTFVETHYKINVDHDYIETYLVVYAIKEKLPAAKEKFQKFIS
ncbi:MAG TPA: hypothetical protein VNJ08_03335 [Bacteriovoracaceae bacterium]|nr:hypothetical protein [Bacteriovoracaceae bacterium]